MKAKETKETKVEVIEKSKETEEVQLLMPGMKVKGIIESLKTGKVSDFVDIDRIQNPFAKEYYEKRRDRVAILVRVYIPSVQTVIEDIIPFSLSTKSRYVQLARKYNKLRIGMEVDICINDYGRPKVC